MVTSNFEKFVRSEQYSWHDEYVEERMSYVDEDKNIVVHESCINLAQESNSQYIPFEMCRYYQGVDLAGGDMELQIYFVNKNNEAGLVDPINVECSENYIRFGWLIDSRVTSVVGDLRFEIRVSGQSSAGTYIWKSKSNSQLTVLAALEGQTLIEPANTTFAMRAQSSGADHTHNFVHIGTDEPTDPEVVLWIDPVNGMKYYDGSAWVNVPIAATTK